MKRITPEQVVEAYKRTGWVPEQGEWVRDKPGGKRCGCALGVMIGDGIVSLLNCNSNKSPYAVVSGALKLTPGYVDGFAQGFDGPLSRSYLSTKSEFFNTGYTDGRDAWEAVQREVLHR